MHITLALVYNYKTTQLNKRGLTEKEQLPSNQLSLSLSLSTSLQLINRDPGVGRKPLEHGEEELEAARPVRQQPHEQRQLEHGGHVHVVDLRPLKESGEKALVVVARGRALTCSSLMATHELEGKP